MKEKIFKNFSLKILSAMCAIILWAVIVNIYDPTTGVTKIGVNVQLINTESLTDKGYTYEVLDGSKISVYISGPKSVITDIKDSDIIATADLSKITAFADYVDIDVKIVQNGQELTSVEVTPKTTAVKLNIENRVTQNYDIGIQLNGNLADGYSVVSQSVSPSSVKITGPSSVMSRISKVVAVYDVTGINADVADSAMLTLYDSDEKIIDESTLDMSRSSADINIGVAMSKKVPLKYVLSGSVADGYSILKVDYTPQEVVISGEAKTLENIKEITIPAERLNIDGSSTDRYFKIKLSDIVPEGVTVVSDDVASVTVKIGNVNGKEIKINTSDIQITNVLEGATARIVDLETLTITVLGNKDVTDSVQAKDITATINLEGQTQGMHTVPIQFTLPTGCSISGSYTIKVNIEMNQSTTQPVIP
jgi:YbbR domain-containing protein